MAGRGCPLPVLASQNSPPASFFYTLPLPSPPLPPLQGFQGEFLWQGTRDYTALLTLPAAVAVLRALGLERAAHYRHGLLRDAVLVLQQAWGTREVGAARHAWKAQHSGAAWPPFACWAGCSHAAWPPLHPSFPRPLRSSA